MLWPQEAIRINTIEQLQPDPLVVHDTSKDLNDLCKGLRFYADSLGALILLTWSNPCLIFAKLGELEEMVDDHDLLGAWFSAHVRVDGAVVMVTAPEICLVSLQCFCFRSDKIMVNRCELSHDRLFWGQLLAALLLLTISLRWPAIIGVAFLKLAAGCWVERTWGNSRPCVMMITPFAGMSIISMKSGRKLPEQGPGTSASWMGWLRRTTSER